MTEKEAMELKHVWIIVFAGQKQKLKEIVRPRGFRSVRELLQAAFLLILKNPEAVPWDELRAIAYSDELEDINRCWNAHITARRKQKGAKND